MNNTITRGLSTVLCLAITSGVIFAQISFKLQLQEDEETYLVSMVPEKTWEHPYNITSTAQVTIVAPAESFEVTELKSLQPGIEWLDNSRSDAPAESPGNDYISFGLASLGVVDFDYRQGVEIPLFTFKNALPCQGSIRLIENDEDPFMAPNSRNANVGNTITTFGARGEAFTGIMEGFAEAPCSASFSTSTEDIKELVTNAAIFPNPALNEIFVKMYWQGTASEGILFIRDGIGKEIIQLDIELNKGIQQYMMPVNELAPGMYSVELVTNDKVMAIDRFVKATK